MPNVFENRCGLPYVEAIGALNLVPDCNVPVAPATIYDCADSDVLLDISTLITIDGSSTTVNTVNIAAFYLDADLAKGSDQLATRLGWNGSSWEPIGPPMPRVYDSLNFGPAKFRCRGVAIWSTASARWEIISLFCRPPDLAIVGVVTSTTSSTSSPTFDATIKEVLFGEIPDAVNDTVTVNNQSDYSGGYVFDGPPGLVGQVFYDRINEVYFVNWLTC